jgi:hypothetical protein
MSSFGVFYFLLTPVPVKGTSSGLPEAVLEMFSVAARLKVCRRA